MDVNGNGHLSLAELDMGIGYVLKLSELMNAKPVIIRAFNAAKNRGNRGLASSLRCSSASRYSHFILETLIVLIPVSISSDT